MSDPLLSISFNFGASKGTAETGTSEAGGCNERGARITLTAADLSPFDVNAVAADAKVSNTSFGYSGRHDHGSLPILRTGAPDSCNADENKMDVMQGVEDGKLGRAHTAKLISALMEAKSQCDAFITLEMKQGETLPSPEKKPRLEVEE